MCAKLSRLFDGRRGEARGGAREREKGARRSNRDGIREICCGTRTPKFRSRSGGAIYRSANRQLRCIMYDIMRFMARPLRREDDSPRRSSALDNEMSDVRAAFTGDCFFANSRFLPRVSPLIFSSGTSKRRETDRKKGGGEGVSSIERIELVRQASFRSSLSILSGG